MASVYVLYHEIILVYFLCIPETFSMEDILQNCNWYYLFCNKKTDARFKVRELSYVKLRTIIERKLFEVCA